MVENANGHQSHPHSHSPSPSPTLDKPRPSRQSSDASSNRSRASSTTGHILKEQLKKARIECPSNPHNFLVPRSAQEELITVAAVTNDIMATDPRIEEVEAAKYANDACRYARQLYATLAYIKKGSDINDLLKEKLTDDDLPLVRVPDERSKFTLRRQNGQPILTMGKWEDNYLERFDRVQWWMTAPVFAPGEHHEFGAKTILPFIPFPQNLETPEKKQGAYSKVYPVLIHSAHHEFFPDAAPSDNQELFAVKELFSSEKSEFQKEATILERLGPKNHPHLIKLLATYEKEDTYHLLFPYANANLRKYWDDHPTPDFDRETVLWALHQITGIASGIVLIHDCKVTQPLSVRGAGKGNFRNPGNVVLSVEGKEQWFGRHGDIKPENILWFSRSNMYAMGVLQIADFGLGRFHGRDSRSGVSKNVVSSPTYEPPECKLSHPVSRAYDIWSLGCLYLEFITWLLKGTLEIDGFSEARGRVPTGSFVNDDNFYTITTSEHGIKDAKIREGVQDWVTQLHAHPKCSQLIHDLLDLIMNELLVIDAKDRIEAAWLYKQLRIYLVKAKRDDEYLLKANPIPIVVPEEDSRLLLELPNGKPKRSSVTFSDQERPIRPPNNTNPKSQPSVDRPLKDMFGRPKGTPGLNKIHPRTWPEKK